MVAFYVKEYANMLKMCMMKKGDVREARREYKKKYPCCLLPDIETFISVHTHFITYNNLTECLELKKDPVSEIEELEWDIIELLREDPTLSNRKLKQVIKNLHIF